VLLLCTPDYSIIIMDNASIYKDLRIREACSTARVTIEFLPPYLPDYNPIEATFKDLKAWIKRNHILAEDFDSFENFLYFAVNAVALRDARGHFREAGYVVAS
jgi:transposase